MEDHTSDQRLNRRIAIIGAGAAGITAAETLRQKGYTHVVVFERSDRVGGKCFTTEINGRLYELGAGVISENNKTVLELARRFDVPLERVVFGKSLLVDAQTGARLSKKSVVEVLVLLKQCLFIYQKILAQHQTISNPGFTNVDSQFNEPFSVFAKNYKIEQLAQEFSLFFTGFGYGYFDQIPAAYVLKYYSWKTLMAFIKRRIYFFPGGIQSLWNRVAEQHDVRLCSEISHIERGESIKIYTDGESEEFDVLIITSPLDETHEYLNQTEQEKRVFSKILYVDYRTILCSIPDWKKMSGYVPGNFISQRPGFPVFWNFRHSDSDVYTFYVLGDWIISDETVIKNVSDLVKKMGGTLQAVHEVVRWKYFPHFDSDAMKAGSLDVLDSMQGNHNTYYAGELFNFSTVGLTSEYAVDLIKRFF